MSYRAFEQIIEDLHGLVQEYKLPFELRQLNHGTLVLMPLGASKYIHYGGRRLEMRKTVDARGGWGPSSVEFMAHDPAGDRTVLLMTAHGFTTRKMAAVRFAITGPDSPRHYAREIAQVLALCGVTWLAGAERSGVGGICDQCPHQLMCLTREE